MKKQLIYTAVDVLHLKHRNRYPRYHNLDEIEAVFDYFMDSTMELYWLLQVDMTWDEKA